MSENEKPYPSKAQVQALRDDLAAVFDKHGLYVGRDCSLGDYSRGSIAFACWEFQTSDWSRVYYEPGEGPSRYEVPTDDNGNEIRDADGGVTAVKRYL